MADVDISSLGDPEEEADEDEEEEAGRRAGTPRGEQAIAPPLGEQR